MSLPFKVFVATLAAAFAVRGARRCRQEEQAQEGRGRIHDDTRRSATPRYQSVPRWPALF